VTLLYIKSYTRRYIQAHPDWLFVFGDNFARAGLGGQAKEARGEPNAIGIATKKLPDMGPGAFLSDKDYDAWFAAARPTINRLYEAARVGRTIIWPLDGIGTGLARLESKAPMIWAELENVRAWLDGVRERTGTEPTR
jgi:hypothetical protein